MKYHTRQELFNLAYLGLAAQGWKRSYTEEDGCVYRGPDGAKCAIGHCIPDYKYRKYFESNTVNDERVLLAARIAPEDEIFAGNLQAAHDKSISGYTMKANLEGVAMQYGLEIPNV